MATALENACNALVVGEWTAFSSTGMAAAVHHEGGSGNIFPYASTMAYDATRRKSYFFGTDHGQTTMWEAVYDEDTNSWSSVEISATLWSNHGYSQTAIDPASGTLYRNKGGNNETRERAFNAGTFTDLSPAATGLGSQVNNGTCWWTGPLDGAGPHGAWFLYFQSGGSICLYDPVADAWIAQGTDIPVAIGFNGYHGGCWYSEKHNCAIVGGGNDSNFGYPQVYRMDSDWSITQLPDAPGNWGNGPFAKVAVCPVTGNFLFLGWQQFWELDPRGSGTWTNYTSTRTPPAGIDDTGESGTDNTTKMVTFSAYGTTIWVWATTSSAEGIYLYKHATSATPPPQSQLGLVLR